MKETYFQHSTVPNEDKDGKRDYTYLPDLRVTDAETRRQAGLKGSRTMSVKLRNRPISLPPEPWKEK